MPKSKAQASSTAPTTASEPSSLTVASEVPDSTSTQVLSSVDGARTVGSAATSQAGAVKDSSGGDTDHWHLLEASGSDDDHSVTGDEMQQLWQAFLRDHKTIMKKSSSS